MENLEPYIKVPLKTKYSQNDDRWKHSALGAAGTIGQYGCLETDATNAANYFGATETPLTVNQKMAQNNGYQDGNKFKWAVFAALFGLKYSDQTQTPNDVTTEQMNKIRSTLDKGYPVFLQIDTIPVTSALDEHWIQAIGYDGDDFIVHDPWDGATKRITSWGVRPQKLIYAFCWYEGKIPTQNAGDVLIQVKTSERDWLVSRATVAKEVAQGLQIPDPDHASTEQYGKVIAGFKGATTACQTTLTNTNTELAVVKQDLLNREEQVARISQERQESDKLYLEQLDALNKTIKNTPSVQAVQDTRVKALEGQLDTASKDKGRALLQAAEWKAKYEAAVAGKSASENQVIAFLKKVFRLGS